MCSSTDVIVLLVLSGRSARNHLKLPESWFCNQKRNKKPYVKHETSSALRLGPPSTVSAQVLKALCRKAFARRGYAGHATEDLLERRCRAPLSARLSTFLGL